MENNKDTTYEIESGLFCDGLADYDVQYTAMDVKDAIQTFNDDDTLAVDVSGYGDKAGWRVFNADGSDTGYRIFRMDDEIWIGHWGWYGSNKDSWLCDYIFRVDSPALSDSAADNGVDTGKDLTLDVIVENFRARQYNCNVVLPGDWEGLYTISQSDYGITFYDEANADYGGCLFGIYWLTGDEAKSPWEHGIINDGYSLIKETEGGGFYAVYPYTDVEFDSEDAAKAAEYRSMLADMNGIETVPDFV